MSLKTRVDLLRILRNRASHFKLVIKIDKKYYILYGKNMRNERTIQRLFEWDYEKEQRNIKIHKISFETAKLVFNDDKRIEFFDVNHSGTEDRLITIGKVDKVLFVVYTERGDKTRIISARAATKAERRLYGNSYIGSLW